MSFETLFLSVLAGSASLSFGYQMKLPSPINKLFSSVGDNPCDSIVPVDPNSLIWNNTGTPPWKAEPTTTVYNSSIVTSFVNSLRNEMVPGLPTTFGQTFQIFQDAGCLLYMHGGAVRDFLLNNPSPKDIDVEYSCSPSVLKKACLQKFDDKLCHIDGNYFNVGKLDPSSPFEELEGVNWDGTIFAPAYTKEYTTNALSYDLNGNNIIIDLIGTGVNDTCSRAIRIPVQGSERIEWMMDSVFYPDNGLSKLARFWKLRAEPKSYNPADDDTLSFITSNIMQLWQSADSPIETVFRNFYCSFVRGTVAQDDSGCYVNTSPDSSIINKINAYNAVFQKDIGTDWYNTNIVNANVNNIVVNTTCNYMDTYNLNNLDVEDGFIITGISVLHGVKGLGDVNGDNIDDFAIADFDGNQGVVHVIYGNANSSATVSVNSITTQAGYHIIDNALRNNGTGIGYIGDVNNDGLSDIIGGTINWNVGLPYGFVYFGSSNETELYKYTGSLNGNNGFLITSGIGNAIGGSFTNKPADFNGDGISDILTGGPADSGVGYTCIIFGNQGGFSSSFDVKNLNGKNGIIVTDNNQNNYFGMQITDLGDINGDNIDDIAMSDSFATVSGGAYTGITYVIFGNQNPTNNFSVNNLNGSNGFAVQGIYSQSYAGSSISGNGDFNGDGYKDLLIGAPGSLGSAGQAYIVFGSSTGYPAAISLDILNGQNGFAIDGTHYNDALGASVSFIGDFNNDGLDDIFLGQGIGTSYILFGNTQSMPATFFVSQINGCNGITINGLAASTVGSGDFNNDGVVDVIMATGSADHAAVLFGQNPSIFQDDD